FWEETDQPSLKKFLDFRFSAGDIEEMIVEYARYKNELNTISRYYTEASEFGTPTTLRSVMIVVGKTVMFVDELCVMDFGNHDARERCEFDSKQSSVIKGFWKLIVEGNNIEAKKKLQEDKAKAKVQKLQATQHITIASVTTEQIQKYAASTTNSITKRFINADNEDTAKRIRTFKLLQYEQDSKDDNIPENNNSLVSDEKFSNSEKDAIDRFFSGSFTQVSPINPCILKCGEEFNENKVLKSLCSKECWKEIQGLKLHLVEESLLERINPVFKKVENDNQTLYQKYAQAWANIGDNDITEFEQYSLIVTHIFIREFTCKRNVIAYPLTTESMWSTIMSFIIGNAIRGNIDYTWGEIELNTTATRKDNGQDILLLPKLATGHKGDGTGLSNDGRECFVLEISYAPQNQDRRKTAEDLYKLLREMRDMLHISKKEKLESGYKIPKSGLCVYGPHCYGYTQDLFEMEYIRPFYFVRKIGSLNISNNDITKLPFVLRMNWAFKKRIISANEVWNNLKSQYENDSTLELSDDEDGFTKMTPKKQSKRS
ncbi:18641_t:CDS:2, partial [Funneliformis geosporum]